MCDAPARHLVALALGANLGDRHANIERALRELEMEGVVTTGTSFLYESAPMYVADQPRFLNCVVTCESTLPPHDLLALLKDVERRVGRVAGGARNGPRVVDLDIVFYDELALDTRVDGQGDGCGEGELVIPHLRLAEREFVLRPLNDVLPGYIHPVLQRRVRELLAALPPPSTLHKVLAFPTPHGHARVPPVLWRIAPSPRTYIMAILNASPDSFSSAPGEGVTDAVVAAGLEAAAAGADMLDVGGYSTRPGAARVSPAEEIARVVPVVKALRAAGVVLPISVDTFRPGVLRAAVEAGANCLNDVTALSGEGEEEEEEEEEEMAAAVCALCVPVVMMHSRGAHRAGADREYGPPGALGGVRAELRPRVAAALRLGVRRWSVLVDPGFGFSKTTAGNVELLRGLPALTAGDEDDALRGLPVLVGLSRKSFLGAVLGREVGPREREWATAGVVAAAVERGADVVRVHDVGAMRDVVAVADAVWRI